MHSCYSFGTIPPSPYKRTCCIHPQLKEKPSIKPHKNNYSNSWVSPDWLTRSLNSITISSPKLEELVGGALFLALFKWMNLYGPIYRLVTGPKSFVILSDPAIADHVLRNYAKYSKGFLAEVSQVFIAQRPLWTMDKSRRQRRRMGKWKQWLTAAVVVSIIVVLIKQTGSLDKEAALGFMRELKDRVGFWAIPAYIGIHTLTLALCLPYAVFFEAAASLIFGFFPALLCVFSAKVLGASLSFFIGRILFRSSSSATEWVQRNKYFHVLLRGVERDGWKFVLLARFSPIPSYVINYGLAATKVNFFVDFLLPTVIGCIPMILQNTSIGSLAGAAVSSSSSQKSRVWSYIFPLLGILSSILISIRVKKYSSLISVADDDDKSINTHDSSGHTADSAHLAEPEKKKSS